jgi:hypothetical protein
LTQSKFICSFEGSAVRLLLELRLSDELALAFSRDERALRPCLRAAKLDARPNFPAL